MAPKRQQVKKMLLSRESKAAAEHMFDQLLQLSFQKAEEKQNLCDLSFALENAAYKFHFSNARFEEKIAFTYRHDAVLILKDLWEKYTTETEEEWNYDISLCRYEPSGFYFLRIKSEFISFKNLGFYFFFVDKNIRGKINTSFSMRPCRADSCPRMGGP